MYHFVSTLRNGTSAASAENGASSSSAKAESGEDADGEAAGEKAASEDRSGFFTPNDSIDFSNVKIEPLFEEQVDFDTFSKSDFRAVKVKECSAVSEVQEALKVRSGRRYGHGSGDFKRYSRLLRAGRAGRKDPDCHHKSPAESDDGNRLLRYAPVRGEREKRRGRDASSDGGQPHPGRREAVLIRG